MRLLALMLAAAAAAAGCASSRPPRQAAVQPQRPAGQARASQIAAAARLLTDDASALRQQRELNLAQQRSMAGCMQRLGYRYLSPSPARPPTAAIVTADVAAARTRHLRGAAAPGRPGTDPEDAYLRQLPGPQRARYSAALLGSQSQLATTPIPGGGTVSYGTGGCLGTARRQLFGSLPAFILDSYLPQVADLRFGSYLASYRLYTAALRGWRQCMAAAGQHFTSPAAALKSVEALAARSMTTARSLAADQRAVAGADAACGARTGLRRRRHDGLLYWLHTLPSTTLTQLRSVYLTRQRAVAAAQRG